MTCEELRRIATSDEAANKATTAELAAIIAHAHACRACLAFMDAIVAAQSVGLSKAELASCEQLIDDMAIAVAVKILSDEETRGSLLSRLEGK